MSDRNPVVQPQHQVRVAVAEYRSQGVAVCRVKVGEKRPTDAEWTERSAEQVEFGPEHNVGIQCGSLSSGGKDGQFLVCVDLDAQGALAEADKHLPETGAIEGHPGKPRSHRYYYVTDVPDWAESKAPGAVAAAKAAGRGPGPRIRHFKHAETGKGLFDFIGTGGQVVAPPSRREDGTQRAWADGCSIDKAAVIPFETLWTAVESLAKAVGVNVPERREPQTAEEDAEDAPPATAAAAHSGQVKGTCTRVDAITMEERVKRCGQYLQKTDLAESGHGGHDKTFRVARLIVNDFAVTDRDAAMSLMRGYNQRLEAGGQETWTESELEHKHAAAVAAEPDPKYPLGFKLTNAGERECIFAWDDPARLAKGFLETRTVRFVKQTAFEYRDGAYCVVSQERLKAVVRTFIEREAAQEAARRGEAIETQRRARTERLEAPAPADLGSTLAAARARDMQRVRQELERLTRPVAPKVTQSLVSNTIDAIASRGQLPDEAELDSWLGGRTGPAVLAVGNGLLDPVKKQLQLHTPDWFSTARLPVAFDPRATEPTEWQRVLGELLQGDAERTAVVQEMFGACLDRGLRLKWFGAFVGSGDNGKSVVLAVLRILLGAANCSSVNLDELSTNRFAAFSLFGKLANIVGDQGHFESADEGRLKTLTGGDLVTFEQKGKDTFSAVNRAKLLFACNSMPTFADKTYAVWNRLVAVPFEYTVPAERKNPALLTAEYWADELPAILNWALDGLARLRERGRFTHSAKCEAIKARTRTDSNPALQFIHEECEFTGKEGDHVTVEDMYSTYYTWCGRSGFKRPLTKPKFGQELRRAFPGLGESKVSREKGEESPKRRWIGLRYSSVTGGNGGVPAA